MLKSVINLQTALLRSKKNRKMKKKILVIPVLVIIFVLTGSYLYAQTSETKPFSVKVIGKGATMLFIPGLTCSGAIWDSTIAKYSKNYRCHVFTLAGYAGQPPIEKSPYLDAYKDAIIQYIKAKKLDHVILVGNSIGGFLALRIATEMQQLLEKIITVDGLPFVTGMTNPTIKDGFDKDAAKKSFVQFDKMDDNALKATQLNTSKFFCVPILQNGIGLALGVSNQIKYKCSESMEAVENSNKPE